jgi:beta-lactamase class A
MDVHAFRRLTVLGLVVPLTVALGSARAPQETGVARLEAEIERFARGAGGTVGVSAVHLESGRSISLNGGERFPMASTYKVPIAVRLFERVDAGEVDLAEMITLAERDLHPGSGEISQLLNDPGVSLSVLNLTELMLLVSDNSATDLVLKTAGGAEAVNARLRELGIDDISVNRPTIELIADWSGVVLPPEEEWSPQAYRRLSRAVDADTRRAANEAFDADPRDTATPDAMTALLQTIWNGEALSDERTAQLLDIMRRCMTGEGRIKGLLPRGTEVMHKTGSIGGTINDTGIITLPDDAGHVALTAFIKASPRTTEQREAAIAQIARSIYDYFLFVTEGF